MDKILHLQSLPSVSTSMAGGVDSTESMGRCSAQSYLACSIDNQLTTTGH
jgi:hypothetical protein